VIGSHGAVIRRDWPPAIERFQLLANTNSGNGKLRPETLGAPRRETSPERAKRTAETGSLRAGYGNVGLIPTLGSLADSRRLLGGGRSPTKLVSDREFPANREKNREISHLAQFERS
jgi:hypothetical protein